MSVNSRRPRQSMLPDSKEVTGKANAMVADADNCPACGLVAPWLGGKHGQTCQPLRRMAKDALRIHR